MATSASISRREVIKRGALVGGAVWAAPSVMKLSPAYGQQEPSPGCICPNQGQSLFKIQYEIPSAPGALTQVPVQPDPTCEPGCWDVAAEVSAPGKTPSSTNWDGSTATVTFKSNQTMVSRFSNCGSTDGCTEGTYDPSTSQLTFVGCEAGKMIYIVYCG